MASVNKGFSIYTWQVEADTRPAAARSVPRRGLRRPDPSGRTWHQANTPGRGNNSALCQQPPADPSSAPTDTPAASLRAEPCLPAERTAPGQPRRPAPPAPAPRSPTREMVRGCSKSRPPTRRKPHGPGPVSTMRWVPMCTATPRGTPGSTGSARHGSSPLGTARLRPLPWLLAPRGCLRGSRRRTEPFSALEAGQHRRLGFTGGKSLGKKKKKNRKNSPATI